MAILDLAAVAEYVLPWTVVALTYGAFETLPYEDALLKMKEGLVMIDRRAAMYDVKFAASIQRRLGIRAGPYNRLMAAKFYAGISG